MTVTDNQILTAVADLTAQKGYPPTFRELGDRVGLSRKSIRGIWARGLKSLKRTLDGPR